MCITYRVDRNKRTEKAISEPKMVPFSIPGFYIYVWYMYKYAQRNFIPYVDGYADSPKKIPLVKKASPL